MKNKILFCLSVFVSTILFDSCKHDSDKKPDAIPTTCVVSKIDYGNYSSPYIYDSLNRIISYTNDMGAFIYDYPLAGKVWINNFSYKRNSEVILNSQGLAISKKRQYEGRIVDWGDVTFSELTQYSYNQDGYLIKEIFSFASSDASIKDYAEEYNYNYEFGNLKTAKFKDKNGNETIWNYTYYEDKLNQLADLQQKLDFKGKKNKNLVKTIEEIKSGTSVISTFTYTFDNNGNLATQTISTPGSTDMVNTYTWTCK